MKKHTHIDLSSYMRGGQGLGDSCTLNGVKKTDSDGSKYSGCE